jgi:hypothetical protein
MLREKFVLLASAWGGSLYPKENEWIANALGDLKFQAGLIDGTSLGAMTAGGKVIDVKGRVPYKHTKWDFDAGFANVLKEFAQLPESERRPAVEDRGEPAKELIAAHDESAPPGGLILNVTWRALKRNPQGIYGPGFLTMDPSRSEPEFNWFAPGPQWDTLWLTEEEWKSLIPPGAKKGEHFPVPRRIAHRIAHYYLYEMQISPEIGAIGPCSSDFHLTVQEADRDAVRLRVHGTAWVFGGCEKHSRSRPCGEKAEARPCDAAYDARVEGMIVYDRAKGSITRFDLAALGDFSGPDMGQQIVYDKLPVGVSFELDPSDYQKPPEFRRLMPGVRFMDKYFGSKNYWGSGE